MALREWKNRKESLVSDKFLQNNLLASNFYIFDNRYGWCFDDNENTAYYDKDNYLHKKWLFEPDHLMFDDDDFIYKINSDGFRTNHFSKIKNDEKVIIFGGCSITSGAGIEENAMWASQLSKTDIFKDYSSYNLSLNGGSVSSTILNFRSWVDKFGAPDYFIALMPDFERNIIYSDSGDEMVKVSQIPPDNPAFKQPWIKKFMTQVTVEDLVFSAITDILMLETLCSALGTKLYWSTWDRPSTELSKKIGFKNFFEVPDRSILEYEYRHVENVNNYKFWNVARDQQHPGAKYNTALASRFYDHIVKDFK